MNRNLFKRGLMLWLSLVLLLPLANAQRQTVKVTGTVSDDFGPMPGVSVKVKGTTVNAITDVDGLFIINASKGGTLMFSCVGYKVQEVKVSTDTNLNIKMEEDAQALDEIVVVGYGTQRKVSAVGAQSALKMTSELKQPVANMTNAIAGRIAGVVSVQRGAEPGNDNSDIWIRGISTFSNSTPLILVDGVERPFNNIDPEDIESFSILKDASATAIYGVKGANGVVLITTKQGKKGKPRIRVEYNRGVTQFTKVPQFADGITYMQMANEALMTRGQAPIYSQEAIRKTYTGEDPYVYPNVVWKDEIFNDFGSNQKLNVNVSGGSDAAQYYVSFGVYDEKGLYKTNDLEQYSSNIGYTRYNFSTNLKVEVTKTTEVTLGIKGYISKKESPSVSADNLFQQVMRVYPIAYPKLYPGGLLPQLWGGGDMKNPYGLLTRQGYHTNSAFQTFSDIRLNQNLDMIVKGLSARVLFSFDAKSSNTLKRENGSPTNYSLVAPGRDSDTGELLLKLNGGGDVLGYNRSSSANRQYYTEAAINYEDRFDDHRVGALVLYNQTDYEDSTADNLTKSIPYRSLGVAGRATYSYADRYMFEFNFGYNGAENFAPGKRFGFFPSFGLGYVLSNEKWYEPIAEYVQFAKFRFTWGKSGNSKLNADRRFAYLATVDGGTGSYTYGEKRENKIDGIDIKDYAADVTWETSTKSNIGIDVNLFDNSLALQFDLFTDTRENIFLNREAVPDYIGLRNTLLGNIGVVDNRGYEITADWTKTFGEFTLGVRGNYTFNRSKIIEDDTPYKPYSWMNSRGLPVKHIMGYEALGLLTKDDFKHDEYGNIIKDPATNRYVANVPIPTTGSYMPGDVKFKDINGDGIISEYDKKRIGYNSVPEIVYGFGVSAAWRGFSMGAFFQGVGNCSLEVNGTDFIPFEQGSARGNLYANITERWNDANQNPNAPWPRLTYGGAINENYAKSTYWLRNGNYCRLKTLDFGYTIPSKLTQKIGLSNIRVYFLGYNLFTFSDFDMFDVELGNGNGARYPNIRTFSLGVNFQY